MATVTNERLLNRSVLILGFSESVSNIGNWITMMAVFALLVFRGHGGVAQSGGIMLAGLLPVLLASPLAGWLCDRYDRRLLMIASELLSALLVSVLIFTSSLTIIYPILALQALAGSVMTPARRSVLPQLVAREHFAKTNAFFQQLGGTIKIGAPLLAGGLLAIMDPHTAIVVDVISFLVSAILLSRLPSLEPQKRERAEAPKEQGGTARGESIRSLVLGSVGLRLIFATAFLGIVVIVGFDVLAPVFVRDVLQASEGLFGLLVSLVGVGTVGISLLILTSKKHRDPWTDVVLGILLLSLIPFSFALSFFAPAGPLRIAIAVAGCLLGGAGNGLLNVQASTLLQLLAPQSVLGRASGAFQSTAVAGQLIGILLTPALVPGLLSMGLYFAIAFAALSILILWVLYNLRSVRPTVVVGG
ncbi:MAG TPA: MFS transporter [Spirochaetia bacterium]|nr:MFS transporter [Spirochaetia bacterium]